MGGCENLRGENQISCWIKSYSEIFIKIRGKGQIKSRQEELKAIGNGLTKLWEDFREMEGIVRIFSTILWF